MTWHMWAIIAISWAITFTLRGASFILKSRAGKDSAVHDLGLLMPLGVMLILVIYSLHGVWERSPAAALIGLGGTIILHLWRSSAMLSIFGGVAIYGVALHLLA